MFILRGSVVENHFSVDTVVHLSGKLAGYQLSDSLITHYLTHEKIKASPSGIDNSYGVQ
jgi:hypothetical protein